MGTILVADDDDQLLDLYERWLERDGWAVRTATNGDEAVSALDDTVEVAVLDRQMPAIPGDEVARRASSSHPECNVVIASAFQPDDRIDGSAYDDYLTKPVYRDDLVTAVEAQLSAPEMAES